MPYSVSVQKPGMKPKSVVTQTTLSELILLGKLSFFALNFSRLFTCLLFFFKLSDRLINFYVLKLLYCKIYLYLVYSSMNFDTNTE